MPAPVRAEIAERGGHRRIETRHRGPGGRLRPGRVELGPDQQHGHAAPGQRRSRLVMSAAKALREIHQQQGHVAVFRRLAHRRVHRLVERPGAHVDARRIREEDLHPGPRADAEQAAARRLWPWRYDGQLLADEPVEERGLARVGRTQERRHAGAMGRVRQGRSAARPSASCAAACSASRFVRPMPRARPSSPTQTSTSNRALSSPRPLSRSMR